MEHIKPGSKLNEVLHWVQDVGASDLHLQEGKPARYRVEGRLNVVPAETLPPMNREQLTALLGESLSAAVLADISRKAEVDLSLQMGTTRWRANFSKQQGRQSCSFRIV